MLLDSEIAMLTLHIPVSQISYQVGKKQQNRNDSPFLPSPVILIHVYSQSGALVSPLETGVT